MKTQISMALLFPIICLTGCNSTKKIVSPQELAIIKLEDSFKKKTIEDVRPFLSDDFTFNEIDTSLSKPFLSLILTQLPIKKIHHVETTSATDRTLCIRCDLVIDKYLGIFSKPVDIEIQLNENNSALISKLYLEGVDMDISFRSNSASAEEGGEIELKDYLRIINNDMPIFFDAALQEDAQQLGVQLGNGLDMAKEILGERISFPLGLMLLEKNLSSASISQPVIPVVMNSDDTQLFLYWAYFHEVTELHLVLRGIKDQNTRWFRDGLAEYVAYSVSKQLSPEAHRDMVERRRLVYDGKGKKSNLMEWIGSGETSKLATGIDGDMAQYAAALMFFIDLTDKYGESVIAKLMAKLRNYETITSNDIIKELSKITNSNIALALNEY